MLEEIRLVGHGGLSREAADALGELEEGGGRLLVERLAIALRGSLLVRHAPDAVSDAFLASRVGVGGGLAYGTLTLDTAFAATSIVERNQPIISTGS